MHCPFCHALKPPNTTTALLFAKTPMAQNNLAISINYNTLQYSQLKPPISVSSAVHDPTFCGRCRNLEFTIGPTVTITGDMCGGNVRIPDDAEEVGERRLRDLVHRIQ